MSRPDAAAAAALDAVVIRPGFFVYLDILGDPVRFTTLGHDVILDGTGFPELDGHGFLGVSGQFIDISAVQVKRGGSEQVTGRLSGLREIDNETLNTIGDPANWQGRTAMLWRMIRDEARVQHGAIQHYYTGYMTSLSIEGDPGQQSINIAIESYLAAFSQASNRTYLDQELFDPDDLSARASIAIANGSSEGSTTPLIATAASMPVSIFGRRPRMTDRLSTWDQALSAYLAPLMQDAVFAWGADRGTKRDCALFAAGAVRVMTDVDFAAAYRGRYSTAIGSARALSKHGARTLEATLDAAFPVRAVGHARRGDLVMHDGAVGVCIGADGLFMPVEGAEPGLVRVPRHDWTKAWTV